ncbi:hypothetical protein ACP275_10G007200 [Erythranthe tilingii]
MKTICVFITLLPLIILNLIMADQALSESYIQIGYEVTLAVPTVYTKGFVGRAFLSEVQQAAPPHFRAAITVEAAVEEENNYYSCSLDILLGDVRVWTSGHLSRFYTTGKCVLELTQYGDLRLKGQNERVGWRSGTSGQGVERLNLLRTGNLVLVDALNLIKWQSFNFPTDIMLWGQRLSSQTRLTSFPVNSTLFYSMEIQYDKIALYLNYGKWKYSYWEYQPSIKKNITFMQLTSIGLEIFNGKNEFDSIKLNDPPRFLSLEKSTGNLNIYHYSEEKGKFEATYEALSLSCDLPLSCNKPYGICTLSGECSCIRINAHRSDCFEGNFEGLCGKNNAEMVELRGVISVIKSVSSYVSGNNNVGKKECGELCLDDCNCVAAEFDFGECYLYKMVRGIKQVERGSGDIKYMIKVAKGTIIEGYGSNYGLKKWVIIVVGVVDVFVIILVLGGLGYYYVIWKRRKDSLVNG